MLSDKILAKILRFQKIFSDKEYERILVEAQNNKKNLEDYILEKKYLSEDSLYEAAASFFKTSFVNLKNLSIRKDVLFLIPEMSISYISSYLFPGIIILKKFWGKLWCIKPRCPWSFVVTVMF